MPSFKQTQLDFAAHLRNPEKQSAPEGVENRRLAVYKSLFFNSISSLVAGTFPVLHSLMNAADWDSMIRDFYQDKYNKTPHFPEIPREFVEYLNQIDTNPDKPFIYELAHYEWLELHLDKHLSEVVFDSAKDKTTVLNGKPCINTVSSLQAYHYPVHQISAKNQPTKPLENPIFLLLWRNSAYQVKFTELNAFSAMLWESLKHNEKLTGKEILEQLADKNHIQDSDQFITFGAETLFKWQQQNIISNTTTPS